LIFWSNGWLFGIAIRGSAIGVVLAFDHFGLAMYDSQEEEK